MTTLTLRTIFEEATVLSLLAEPEFAGNYVLLAARDVKPTSDHYLAVFAFSAEPVDDGSRVLRIISTTVVGIQRYTTTRLQYQGIHLAKPGGGQLAHGDPSCALSCATGGHTGKVYVGRQHTSASMDQEFSQRGR